MKTTEINVDDGTFYNHATWDWPDLIVDGKRYRVWMIKNTDESGCAIALATKWWQLLWLWIQDRHYRLRHRQ